MTSQSPFTLVGVECLDLKKPSKSISTGIGFFDHMIDQLNSHAQIGVSVTATRAGANAGDEGKNRFADPANDQGVLIGQVGSALGSELKKLLSSVPADSTSRFCCPLDEALVECVLEKLATNGRESGAPTEGMLVSFTLPPYGVFPAPAGRTKIGRMTTKHVRTFFDSLARASGLLLSLNKIRGSNGHHVVESAFKAFSRAARNLIDGTTTATPAAGSATETALENMWGVQSESYTAGRDLKREGSLERSTKETSILVRLQLDWMHEGVNVNTGLKTMDDFVSTLAKEAKMSLEVTCKGDLYVDDHHTSEDVAIALGQVLNNALGTKAGLNRMWCAVSTSGDAEVEVTMDLSNRPCLTHNLSLSSIPNGEEYVGDMSVEMLEHVIESLVMNGQMTVHIVERKSGSSVMETALATAGAFGKALRMCAAVDPRRAGKTASSKGTLSV